MFILLPVIVVLATCLYGQSFTAALRGVVTDGSGAAVPGAKVIIIEAERNVPHPVVTDEAGRYNATALPPGQYTIAVEAMGFKKQTRPAFQLLVQQQATMDFKLE